MRSQAKGGAVTSRRRWRKVDAHEYTLAMGPVTIEVFRTEAARADSLDQWWWRAAVGHRSSTMIAGRSYREGAQLAQCQADAIAAVERWRDEIR